MPSRWGPLDDQAVRSTKPNRDAHQATSGLAEDDRGYIRFQHMGKLVFYLEALDRDRKRPHENPSIGVLLCRTKDDEVVEYAMSRHLSPALVAQYETQMISKTILQQKLHEWSQMLQTPQPPEGDDL